LHPNSLRYRLARIEELIGRSLRLPSTIADLHIALLAERSEHDRGPHPTGHSVWSDVPLGTP
jgi:DNA-binding PucR family transcriptional regulator